MSNNLKVFFGSKKKGILGIYTLNKIQDVNRGWKKEIG